MYRFTVTAKLGFIYHIPGPDEDPDDPSTNTCPLDPVLENKLNMRAALPKQIFGMLVPKELPDVRSLMPYSLRLPHARDALDCSFDLMGPVSFTKDELEDVKAFHAAMMEGPQKKKDPKKVAEELRRLTDAARKALGELPDADELDPPPKPTAPPPQQVTVAGQGGSAGQGSSAGQGMSAAADTEASPAGQGTPGNASASAAPEHALTQQQQASDQPQASAASPAAAAAAAMPAAAAPQAASPSGSTAAAMAAANQPQQPSEDTDMTAAPLPDVSKEQQAGQTTDASAAAASAANTQAPEQADAVAEDPPQAGGQSEPPNKPDAAVGTDAQTLKQAEKAKTDEAPKTQDPVHVWNELTKHTEGDNEDFEDKFIHNYFFVPLKLWLDWEDVVAKLPPNPPRELDWDAVRHVKHGWKPLTTMEEVSRQGAGQSGGFSAMEVDGDQPVPKEISHHQAPGDQLVPNGAEAMQTDVADASKDSAVPSMHPEANGVSARDASVPEPGPKEVRMGPLDPQRLANSVMVTTYNSTPYFFEGIDPELTPQSRFPDDKLKLQAVVEQEEEDDFLKPKPPKETDTPTDQQPAVPDESAGTDNDKGGESEGQPGEAAVAAAAAKHVTVVAGREAPKADTPEEFVVRLIASKQAATFTDYFK